MFEEIQCRVMERMWTVNELAEHMRVHRNTVLRWIASGRLTATKPGGWHWRITDAEAKRIIEGGLDDE